LDQAAEAGGGHRVEVTLSDPADPRVRPQRTSVPTRFSVAAADQERLRWYLEDFLEYPVEVKEVRTTFQDRFDRMNDPEIRTPIPDSVGEGCGVRVPVRSGVPPDRLQGSWRVSRSDGLTW
jgi:hypothetical protein